MTATNAVPPIMILGRVFWGFAISAAVARRRSAEVAVGHDDGRWRRFQTWVPARRAPRRTSRLRHGRQSARISPRWPLVVVSTSWAGRPFGPRQWIRWHRAA